MIDDGPRRVFLLFSDILVRLLVLALVGYRWVDMDWTRSWVNALGLLQRGCDVVDVCRRRKLRRIFLTMYSRFVLRFFQLRNRTHDHRATDDLRFDESVVVVVVARECASR